MSITQVDPLTAIHDYIIVLTLLYYQGKLLGMEWLFKHQDLQMFDLKLYKYD